MTRCVIKFSRLLFGQTRNFSDKKTQMPVSSNKPSKKILFSLLVSLCSIPLLTTNLICLSFSNDSKFIEHSINRSVNGVVSFLLVWDLHTSRIVSNMSEKILFLSNRSYFPRIRNISISKSHVSKSSGNETMPSNEESDSSSETIWLTYHSKRQREGLQKGSLK